MASPQISAPSFARILDETIMALQNFEISTTLATFPQVELPAPFRFLELPGELRNQVYTELLNMLLEPPRCAT